MLSAAHGSRSADVRRARRRHVAALRTRDRADARTALFLVLAPMFISPRKTPLLHIVERVTDTVRTAASLTLPFDLLLKIRLRVQFDDVREAALALPRGTALR